MRTGLPALFAIAACGHSTSVTDASPEAAIDATSDAGAQGCFSATVGAGDSTQSITVDGGDRAYTLHVPPDFANGALPLVVGLHGALGTGAKFASRTGLSAKADNAGFVAAFPDGLSGYWNAGSCCAPMPVDDVGFVRAMIADLSKKLCIDPRRVYAIGLSNGAMLSHRLACEAADLFAAVATVSGPLVFQPCTPSRPIAVLSFHGTADTVVPYDGDATFPSAPSTFSGWAMRNGCTDSMPSITFSMGMVSCATYSACNAGSKVSLCTIAGGGHCWPGESACGFGTATQDISATDAGWDFLRAFSRP